MEFNQSQWLKPYVEFNTQNRIEAKKYSIKAGKALFKLMNNAAYGKTMENVRNRIDATCKQQKSCKQQKRLVSNKKGYLKWTSELGYISQKIFSNESQNVKIRLH